jgi:hypothetical protein
MQTLRPLTWHLRVVGMCLAVASVALTLSACSDDPQSKTATPVPVETKPAIHRMTRLGKLDHIEPERWLASREAGRDLPLPDPAVAKMRQTLRSAERNFREFPRMIANRAVQLENMLGGAKGELAPDLIARLSHVAGNERYVDSFGSVCQQYFHLRSQGMTPEAAIESLKHASAAGN